MAKRVQIQTWRKPGGKKPDNVVIVARPSKWGNPFPVSLLGRERAVMMFRELLDGFFNPGNVSDLTDDDFAVVWKAMNAWQKRIGFEPLRQVRAELRGKDLACYCPLDAPCHADVLLELANAPEGGAA